MNTLTRTIFIAAIFGAATLASAQTVPPSMFHYQGRLATTSGVPITTTQQFWFSIYVGGSAGTANSGSLKYQEKTSLTPDANGIFEQLVGTGTKVSGSIKPSDFNTSLSVYLEVAVGSSAAAANVLLPRARFSSAAYSFVASNAVGDITPKSVSIPGYGTVINSSGQWTGKPIASNLPTVTAITDVTGGPTVSGDVVRLTGTKLGGSSVFVNGRQARVKSNSGTQLVFQVPAGLPTGMNQVSISTGTLQVALNVGNIKLTRYLMLVSYENDRVMFFDPDTLTVAGTISVNFADPNQTAGAVRHIQPDFASEGALMLLPDNRTAALYAIDLTKYPIGSNSIVQSLTLSAVSRTVAVAIDPSEKMAAVADPDGNRIRIVSINETFPPFAAPLANTSTITDLQPQPPSSFKPLTLRFINSQVLIADGNNGVLQIFQNLWDYAQDRYEWSIQPSPAGYSSQFTTSGPNAYQMELTPDRERIVLLNAGSTNLQFIWPANWFTSNNGGPSVSTGQQVFQFSMSNNGWMVLASPSEDMLRVFKMTDDNIVFTNILKRQEMQTTYTGEAFRNAAVEPIDGDFIVGYTATTNGTRESLFFYRVLGGTLDRVDKGDPLDTANKLTEDGRYSIENQLGSTNLGVMQYLP